MMYLPRMVPLTHEDAQRIFDLAVGADQACSGYMETDDVRSMRRLAVAIGVDPAKCTGSEFVTQFPHRYVRGESTLNSHRQMVTKRIPDPFSGGVVRNVTIRRPETDEEVLARIGALSEVCVAGSWIGRCGKAPEDPIHAVPPHPTCIDVTTVDQRPGSEWLRGADCPTDVTS